MVLVKFAYEDLGDAQFEKLIVILCQQLFGISVQGFAKGPDGGRDAKFVGTAELFPSKAAPWIGTTIIQAKHTNGYNRSFSETDFHNTQSKNTVLGKEILRIKKLRQSNQLDHYLLFANRKLSGGAESEIIEYLATECGIPKASISMCGVEQLEIWLKTFPRVSVLADLDPIDSPLIISPDHLSEIVQAIAKNLGAVSPLLDDPPTLRMSYAEKNSLNKMSDEYALSQRTKYLKDVEQIRTFLAAPENLELMQLYESVVDEFQLKIISKRKDYQTFDNVMEYLAVLLFNRDPILRQSANKRLTRIMLFYMYWHCDIGEVNNATTNKTLSP